MHIGRLCSNWDPIFVQSVHQNFPHVIVVRIKIKYIPNHTGETFGGKFLYGKKNKKLHYISDKAYNIIKVYKTDRVIVY